MVVWKLSGLLFYFFVLKVSSKEDYAYYPSVDKYYKMHLEAKTWYGAREMCKMENATLAMPENHDQAVTMRTLFQRFPENSIKNAFRPDEIFLGANDLYREGQYVTIDDVPLQYYYHIWAPGEPSNSEGIENCLTLYKNDKLNDLGCNERCPYICQKNGLEKPIQLADILVNDPAYKCLDESRCYKLHLNPLKWRSAEEACNNEGGGLAIVENQEEAEFLKIILNDADNKPYQRHYKHYAFVGFHKLLGETTFVTVDDRTISGYMNENWMTCNLAENDERCGAIYKTGHFASLDCDVPIQYFCQRSNILSNLL